MRTRRVLASLCLLGGIGAATWRLTRLQPIRELPAPRPVWEYEAALERVQEMQSRDLIWVRPGCRTQLLTHGRRTPLAVGLLHGFTNCPAQHRAFAQLLHAQGHNVLLPRLSHHGLERLAPDFARLTAEEMVALAGEVADTLHGLGERTLLFGFSLGGAMAAWAAQHRGDLDHVTIVAPALGLVKVPIARRRLYANLLGLMRNRFVWWDAALREEVPNPPHAYPRYSTRAIGQMLRLAVNVEAAARRSIFAADRVTVITNPCDAVVDNQGIARVVREWRRHGGAVETHEFPASWNLIHDLFDPTQARQQTARTYPQLLDWIA